MLDLFQKAGKTKWIIAICVIAVLLYVIYRRKKKQEQETSIVHYKPTQLKRNSRLHSTQKRINA